MVVCYKQVMQEHNLACSCLKAGLQCSGGHEAEQLAPAPIWRCSGWLQRGRERGHAACFLPTLVQRTIDTKRKEESMKNKESDSDWCKKLHQGTVYPKRCKWLDQILSSALRLHFIAYVIRPWSVIIYYLPNCRYYPKYMAWMIKWLSYPPK